MPRDDGDAESRREQPSRPAAVTAAAAAATGTNGTRDPRLKNCLEEIKEVYLRDRSFTLVAGRCNRGS